jgi:hypothetical protein
MQPFQELMNDDPVAWDALGQELALEIQRHSFTNEVLQCIFVDPVIFFDVDGTPDLPVKAGVE